MAGLLGEANKQVVLKATEDKQPLKLGASEADRRLLRGADTVPSSKIECHWNQDAPSVVDMEVGLVHWHCMIDTTTDYRGYRLEPVEDGDAVWHVNFYPLWVSLPVPGRPDFRQYTSVEAALAAGRAQVDRLLAGLPDRRGLPALAPDNKTAPTIDS
jgi:hypothetical protein